MRMPSLPQPTARLRATLLASPIQASVWPSQLADQLADRVQIGQRLAGMAEIGQAVDDRAGAVLGQIDGRLMAIGADHDDVGIFAQDAGEIGDALAAAEAGLVAQEDRAAAEMGHAGLETDPRAQRGFLEDQGHDPARQQRLAQPFSHFCFRSSVIEKMRSISAAVTSARVSKCRMSCYHCSAGGCPLVSSAPRQGCRSLRGPAPR